VTKTVAKEKPIIFSTEMVRAILDGRKTQTRRVVKPQPPPRLDGDAGMYAYKDGWRYGDCEYRNGDVEKPPYPPGTILWVREAWCRKWQDPQGWTDEFLYKADDNRVIHVDDISKSPWKPSIHMPKEAARLFLEVTNVRVERLQDISYKDIFAEGTIWGAIGHEIYLTYQDGSSAERVLFRKLWNKLNGKKYPWESNPFCWVIEFKVVSDPCMC